MDTPVLSARHLRKVYRTGEVDVVALADVSLDVQAGEFIVLLGASGSGKSTLLNILGGLDVPSSGTLQFRDHALEERLRAVPGARLPDGALPAWVSESFAQAHRLQPGDRLGALINGKQRALQVAGIAMSPQYIVAGLWGMPEQRGFGVFWVTATALDAALDMDGAFNRIAITLAPGAREAAVEDGVRVAVRKT